MDTERINAGGATGDVERRRPWLAVCPALFALAAVAGAAACAGGRDASGSQAATVTVSIVGTTDLHGNVLERSGRGGLTRFAGYLKNLRDRRAADGGGVLLVDSGDMFQGTLESNLNEGAAVVAAYNELGYHAAAIGNHEFDFGPAGQAATPASASDDPRGALKDRAAEARFPFLAANVVDTATGQPVAWTNVKPSTLVEVAGVKVGIVGVTTASTPLTTIAANLRGLSVTPLVPAIVREATALRKAGAAVVVVAAHAGGRCRNLDVPADLSSCEMDAEIVNVAMALPRGLVDVILAGHTHSWMAHDVAGISTLEAGSGGLAFSRVDVVVRRDSTAPPERRIMPPHEICDREDPSSHGCDPAVVGKVALVPAQYEGHPVTAVTAIDALLAPAVQEAEARKRRPLGVVLESPFPRSRLVESAMGNLFADAIRESWPGVDIVLTNGGAMRTDLDAGELTYGELYAMYPFDNRIVVIELLGEQLRRVFTRNLESLTPAREILIVSGVRVVATCQAGSLDVRLLRPSGARIRDDERLRVATNDFVASGGDGVLDAAGPVQPGQSGDADEPLIREVLVRWLERRGGRIRPEQYLKAGQRRWVYPGERPVRCAP